MKNALLEQTYKDIQTDKKLPQEIRKATQFDAFVLVAKARNTKHAVAILNCFSNLLSTDSINQKNLRDVLDAIDALSRTTPDIQLKILQLFPLLFAHPASNPRGPDLATALYTIIGLLEKPGIVGSVAGATLQQTLVSLFDNSERCLEDDIRHIFEDLCASFSGNQSELVSFDSVRKSLVLELLESVLVPHNMLFEQNTALLDVSLIPALLDTIRDEQAPYLLVVRAVRICRGLLATESTLLHNLLRLLPSSPLLRQLMIMEALSSSLPDVQEAEYPVVIQSLMSFEDGTPGLGTYSICSAPQVEDEQITLDGLVFTNSLPSHKSYSSGIGPWLQPSKPLINQLNANEPPRTPPNYKFWLLFKCLSVLATRPLTIWKDLLVLHSAFLSSSLSLESETRLLQEYTQVIILLNESSDEHPRDTYLRRLGRMAISSSVILNFESTVEQAGPSSAEPSHRSFCCLESYIRTASTLRDSFKYRSWKQVLDIFSSADFLLSHRIHRGSQSQSSLISNVMSGTEKPVTPSANATADISRLLLLIETFFASTGILSDESFSALIEALCDLPDGVPGSPSAMSPNSSQFNSPIINRRMDSISSLSSFSAPAIGPTQTIISFTLQRLRELLPYNIKRFVENDVTCGWKSLRDYLSREIQGGNIMAAELLGLAITQAAQTTLRQEWQQQRFLEALELFIGDDTMIQVIQLETLAGVLETLGHDLTIGWDLVLRVLRSSVHDKSTSTQDTIRIGFSSLQLICTDLLRSVPKEQLSQVIITMTGYGLQHISFNISLSAVGQFWTILEVLNTRNDFSIVYKELDSTVRVHDHSDDEGTWLLFITSLLQLCQDDRPEVRNSAIQACFRTVKKLETAGSNARLSGTHLLLPALGQVSLSLDAGTEGLVETSNAISAGLGRALLSFTEFDHESSDLLRTWEYVLAYFEAVLLSRPAAIVSSAFKVMFEMVSGLISAKTSLVILWPRLWQTIMNIASGYEAEASVRPPLTEEALALYLDIVRQLCSQAELNVTEEMTDHVMNLIIQALSYEHCSTYTLDVDYLSNVQKSSLNLIGTLLFRFEDRKSQLFSHIARLLKLATSAEARKDAYTSVKSNPTTWFGRPTFVAFTEQMLKVVQEQYNLIQDESLSGMSDLVDSMNILIKSRFSRVSVSQPSSSHEVWKLSARQVLVFVESLQDRLSPAALDNIWPKILDTYKFLIRPESTQSEAFILTTLNSFRGLLMPYLVLLADELIFGYLEALYKSSWFYAESEIVETTTKYTNYYEDNIIREWCLLELYKITILEPVTQEADPEQSIRTQKSAEVALSFAIKRSQNILQRYIINASLRGHAPLPRVEYAELLLLLEHLGDATIEHKNQRILLKSVYNRIVETLLVSHNDIKLLRLLKDVLLRVGMLL